MPKEGDPPTLMWPAQRPQLSVARPSAQGELLLACVSCRRVVAVHYELASKAQGLTLLDEHRTCGYCSKQMVDTVRDPEGRITLPGG